MCSFYIAIAELNLDHFTSVSLHRITRGQSIDYIELLHQIHLVLESHKQLFDKGNFLQWNDWQIWAFTLELRIQQQKILATFETFNIDDADNWNL